MAPSMSNTRHCGRLAIALALGFAVLLSAGITQAKPPDGITIKLSVGYNGWVARSEVNPVIVEMENTSPSLNLTGDLVLEHNGIEYATPLNLPTPSKKLFHLYFPCDNWPPLLTLRVRTRQYSEQFDLVDNRDFRTMESGDSSVVVLTRQKGSLGVLNQLPVAALGRDLYNDESAALTGGRISVSYFNLDEIDNNPKFFSQADTVIVADVDYQQFSAELAEALKACAAGGTSIVFSLGASGLGLQGSPVEDLCPLVPAETVQLDDLGSFGATYGISTAGSQATFAAGLLQPGARVTRMAGEYPAVVQWTYGGGSVTALAFDFTTVPFKQQPGVAAILLDNTMSIAQSAGIDDWFSHPGPISRILSELGEARPLSPGFVALFLLAYVVLIGPVNFLALGRLRRRTLVWVTIPSLIIAFSYFGLSTGYIYRGSNNITAHLQEIHLYPGTGYAPYQTVMLVFTAERTRYQLEVPDRSAFIFPDIPLVLDQHQWNTRTTNRIRGLGGGRIDNSTLPLLETTQNKWTQKDYMYRGNMQLDAKIACQLSAVRTFESLSDLEGTISLDLPFDLQDSYLYAPNFEQTIGQLSGKGTYDIASLAGSGDNTLDPDNYLVASRDQFKQLQKASARLGLTYRDEILLMGFTEDVKALADFRRPHSGNELSMVVIHLPYTPVIPVSGSMSVSLQRLAGGSGFKPADNWGYGGSRESGLYELAERGFIDMDYEIAGQISRDNKLQLNLWGIQDPKEGEVQDVTEYIDAYVLAGGNWQSLQVPAGSKQAIVPVGPALDSGNRTLKVRLVARKNLRLTLPEASPAY